MKKRVYKLLEKPWLSALVVGTLINGLVWLAAIILLGWQAVLIKLTIQWQASPVLVFIQVLVPYLVPFMVTATAKGMNHQKIQNLIKQFPEANPNIVMRFDPQLTLEYINTIGQAWLNQHQLTSTEADQLLPISMVKALNTSSKVQTQVLEGEKTFSGNSFYFKAKKDPSGSVFVTAHDVTENKKLQAALKHTLFQLNQLSSLLNDNLKQYDPRHFNLFQTFKTMLYQIVTTSDQSIDMPDFVFCTFADKDRKVVGQIFQLSPGQVDCLTQPFELENSGYAYAISKGKTDIYFENWQPETQSLDQFQQQFNPMVRKHVGTIEGYATYQSGSVSVIDFFKEQKATHQFNDILKQIAVFGHFFHRISQESIGIYEQFTYSLKALARASEANDEDTGEHIIRINEYAYVMAQALNQSAEFCEEIRLTAMMHDVGKIHLDPAILKKPGKLTDAERTEMMQHPVYGAKILGDSDKMKMAREIALYHHEKYDGSGYPSGIAGDAIPLAARIVGLVDVYDALRQKRVYKPAFSHEKAYRIITEGDGRTRSEEFDPAVLAAFKKIHTQFDAIFIRMT
ncbi:MAG: hypothetical protein AUK56_07300 [Thiomicrospira sp. CG2_30_44_34]|nr:MAG: hypothetical protein AUK56_07300 [Thiomicrospira sp. CG2_30_44_34]